MNNALNRGFSRSKPGELAVTTGRIIEALSGNAAFPNPDPPLAVIQADLAALGQAMALPKGPPRIQAVLAARAKLELDLGNLASNLEQTAAGNLAMLGTTGFRLRKATSQTSEVPETPGNVRLKITGIRGEVRVLFDASKRAKGYQVQSTLDPNSGIWTDYDPFSGSRNITLTGLPRAQDIWVRVRAIGPHHTKSAWSDPATILVH
jgi:hypothetical protein